MSDVGYALFMSIQTRDGVESGGTLRNLDAVHIDEAREEAAALMKDAGADGIDKVIQRAVILQVSEFEELDVSAWDGSRR